MELQVLDEIPKLFDVLARFIHVPPGMLLATMGQPSPGLHLSFQHRIQICGRSPAERVRTGPACSMAYHHRHKSIQSLVLQCSWLYHRQLYHGVMEPYINDHNDHRGIRRSPHFCWCHPYQNSPPLLPGLNFGSSREKPKESFRCRSSSSKLRGKNMKSFTS